AVACQSVGDQRTRPRPRGVGADRIPRRVLPREAEGAAGRVKHVLAIDQGTTGTTALVISADGKIVGRGYQEITQHYPQPGWVEHDADEILERTLIAAREAIGASHVTPDV